MNFKAKIKCKQKTKNQILIIVVFIFLFINNNYLLSYDFSWLRNCSFNSLLRTNQGKQNKQESFYKDKLQLMDSNNMAEIAYLYRDIILDIPDSYLAKKAMKGFLMLLIEAENELYQNKNMVTTSYEALINLRKKEICTIFLYRYPGTPGKSNFYYTERFFLMQGLKIFIKSGDYPLAYKTLENYFDTDLKITEFEDFLLLKKAALLELITFAPQISRTHLNLFLDTFKDFSVNKTENIILGEMQELDKLLSDIQSMGRFGQIKIVAEKFSKMPLSTRDRVLYYKWAEIFTRGR